jgi:hypothetical protein
LHSAGLKEGLAEIGLEDVLRYPERATDADRFEFTTVHEPIDGHLGYAHLGRNLGDGQEFQVAWHRASYLFGARALSGFPTGEEARVLAMRIVLIGALAIDVANIGSKGEIGPTEDY